MKRSPIILGTVLVGLLAASPAHALKAIVATVLAGEVQIVGVQAQPGAAISWEGAVVATASKKGAFHFSSTNLPQDCVGQLSDGVTTIPVVVAHCTTIQRAGVLRTGQIATFDVADSFIDSVGPVADFLSFTAAIPKVIDDAARSGQLEYALQVELTYESIIGTTETVSAIVPIGDTNLHEPNPFALVDNCRVAIGFHLPIGVLTGPTPSFNIQLVQLIPDPGTGLCPSTVALGLDGELRKGVARSYTDNGDGTITDNATGLMWEKLTDDGSIHDWDNFYFSVTRLGGVGQSFVAKIQALNTANFAGHSDWRLPNINELQSLVDYGRFAPGLFDGPAVDPVFNNPTSFTQGSEASLYLSSTSGLFGRPLVVNFRTGQVLSSFEFDFSAFFVRAVRGGP